MPQYVYDMTSIKRNGLPGNGFRDTIDAPNEQEALRQLRKAAECRQRCSSANPASVRVELHVQNGGGTYTRDTSERDW